MTRSGCTTNALLSSAWGSEPHRTVQPPGRLLNDRQADAGVFRRSLAVKALKCAENLVPVLKGDNDALDQGTRVTSNLE